MWNRFYPLVNVDGEDLNSENATIQQQEKETKAKNQSSSYNKWTNRVIKPSQHSQQHSQQSKQQIVPNNSSNNYNHHRVFAASSSSQKSDQQNQKQPDWQHILDRIETYAEEFPPPDEEGIVHLQQGMHFIFCDQFVNTIRYGAALFQGMIVRNFNDWPGGFFSELFKHVAKTQYPDKFIPLVSFSFAHSFPWPQCGLLVEIPRHLEPKVLRKGEYGTGSGGKVIVTLTPNGQLINNVITNVQIQRKATNAQRVMYSLQNEKTGELFYLKIWFDPTHGDTKYKDMKGLTLRAGKSTMTTSSAASSSA